MNNCYQPLFALLLGSLLAFGVATSAHGVEDAASEQEVSKKIEEAISAIKHYSVKQKDEVVKKSKIALDDLDKRIDKLDRRLKRDWQKMDEAARETAQATLIKLRKQRAELAKWYDEVARSSESAWERVKKGFMDSYENLRGSVDKAQEEF